MRGRRNKRYNKKVMFPFGDIMLPVIGLIALGLLIVGVKMFFWPGEDSDDYAFSNVTDSSRVDNQIHSYQGQNTIKVDSETLVATMGNQNSEKIIAVPVANDNRQFGDTPDVVEVTSTQKSPKKTSEKQNKWEGVERERDALTKDRQRWGVQIGSFIEKKAAKRVARQVKDKGFHVQIVNAQISGKHYHRVIVQGGQDKTEATKVARILKSEGFPVFITSVN